MCPAGPESAPRIPLACLGLEAAFWDNVRVRINLVTVSRDAVRSMDGLCYFRENLALLDDSSGAGYKISQLGVCTMEGPCLKRLA